MNVDDAMRELRSSVRGPADGLVDQIVATAPSAPRASSRRRVNGRAVLVAACVSVAVVLVLTLGFVLRDGNRPDPVPAAPAIPPARVDWGMVATVRLKPDQGISTEEMRERFAKALAFRVNADDGAGVEVLDGTGDSVRVRLPGAELEEQARMYLRFSRLVLVSEAEDVVASGRRLNGLMGAAQRLIEPSTPVAYYVQMVESGYIVSQPRRFEKRADALRAARAIGSRKSDLIAVPRSMSVATSWSRSGTMVHLVRATKALPSSAIQNVDADDRDVTITLDPAVAPERDTRVRVFRDDSGVGRLGGLASGVGVGVLGNDGRLKLTTEHPWLNQTPQLDIGGRIVVETVSRYGSRPPVRGRVFTPAGDDFVYRPTRGRKTARWVRVAEGRNGGRNLRLEVAETRGTISAARLYDPRNRRASLGGMSIITFRDGRTNERFDSACPYNIGTPRVIQCAAQGQVFSGDRGGRHRALYSNFGPVQPEVARVTLDWAGVRQDAVVADGWWFAHMSVDVTDRVSSGGGKRPGTTTTGRVDPPDYRSVGSPTVEAWDADGNPIPVPSPTRY